MAVVTKYVVVRNGVELEKPFLVKKEADAYDKMLDAAENLAAFIKEGRLDIDLDTTTIDAISVFLAKNAPDVTRVLKGVKPVVPIAKTPLENQAGKAAPTVKKRVPAAKAAPKRK